MPINFRNDFDNLSYLINCFIRLFYAGLQELNITVIKCKGMNQNENYCIICLSYDKTIRVCVYIP